LGGGSGRDGYDEKVENKETSEGTERKKNEKKKIEKIFEIHERIMKQSTYINVQIGKRRRKGKLTYNGKYISI
jgi:hypothetical protein